jgi:hypothetical protein
MYKKLLIKAAMLSMIISISLYAGINAYGSQNNIQDDNSYSTWEGITAFSLSDLGRALSSF